jgi:TctA family transporter
LIYSRGDLLVFFERPIAATLMALALLMLFSPVFRWMVSSKLLKSVGPTSEPGTAGDKSDVVSK